MVGKSGTLPLPEYSRITLYIWMVPNLLPNIAVILAINDSRDNRSPSPSSWAVTVAASLRFLHFRSGILAAWVFKLQIPESSSFSFAWVFNVIAVGEWLKMALELGYSSIYIEGDAQAIITISMGPWMRLKVANGRFGDGCAVFKVCAPVDGHRFEYVGRGLNLLTHAVARLGVVGRAPTSAWEFSLPVGLLDPKLLCQPNSVCCRRRWFQHCCGDADEDGSQVRRPDLCAVSSICCRGGDSGTTVLPSYGFTNVGAQTRDDNGREERTRSNPAIEMTLTHVTHRSSNLVKSLSAPVLCWMFSTNTITVETSVPFTGHNYSSPLLTVVSLPLTVVTTPTELMSFFCDKATMQRMEIVADSLYKAKLIQI
ncbi:thiamin diphosphate-binding fold (THDP-binding) superfamily protein [Actinidia rufa]|uniref:Thiamin diphosphate-binding fold (THDP-binding) superfamily protein n=1 Tax=Actinidia rufa TaxID=165716 RepID=A0A7J0DU31_9ERIC|nr:thiamin diphosphate-binding fold (THDP-binding) superfamily protein [Actinidia rufa]